jgi:predicted AlkP superfamily pyrophosphatase or phosphodiesterase
MLIKRNLGISLIVNQKILVLRLVSFIFIAALTTLAVADAANAGSHHNNNIRLVLQITVDGLRADLLNRYGDRFEKSGFKYLLQNGTTYTNAHLQHANTETIVGHTTLATGAFPSNHGMIGNAWLDRETGELTYNIEDPKSPLLPTGKDTSKREQVDPAQKLSRTQGRSPANILAATFSDVLAVHFAGRSKIFAVSGKDRGAVPMAGHTGKAFWYSTDSGKFVTSTYYYKAYPEWAAEWNDQQQADAYAGKSWALLHDKPTYLLAAQDDRPYEIDLRGYGRVFPHPFGDADDTLFYTRLLVSPIGDQLTLDFSKELLVHEKLGQDSVPDYLSISFSAVDAVNHFFGPSSLENEDIVLQVDRILAELFRFIDKEVGLKNTLIVLSADHGMAEMPEYMSELGFAAGRLYTEDIVTAANKAGQDLFGIDEVVRFFFRPYLYLDKEKIIASKKDRVMVEQAIANALTKLEGIAAAVPQNSVSPQQAGSLQEQIKRNFHPSRSGDIYVAQDPYWFLFEKGPIAAMHGSPWRYDTHVPIIFAGSGIQSQRVHRSVHPVDVAPTLASFLGMTPPSSSQGSPLEEALR